MWKTSSRASLGSTKFGTEAERSAPKASTACPFTTKHERESGHATASSRLIGTHRDQLRRSLSLRHATKFPTKTGSAAMTRTSPPTCRGRCCGDKRTGFFQDCAWKNPDRCPRWIPEVAGRGGKQARDDMGRGKLAPKLCRKLGRPLSELRRAPTLPRGLPEVSGRGGTRRDRKLARPLSPRRLPKFATKSTTEIRSIKFATKFTIKLKAERPRMLSGPMLPR